MSRRRDRTQTSFEQALPELLADRGISYRQFAAAIGVTQSYLSRSLNGERSPSMRLLEASAKELGLPKDYFPEYRAQIVIEAVEQDSALRERIYASLTRRR